MTARVSIVPSQGGFGSITWANEPPSEAEREQVRSERSLMRSIISDDKSSFEKYLPGININFESSGKTTPLHAAMAFGRSDMVQALIGRKADIHAKNSLGFTPLVSAVVNGHVSCVKLALAAGANKDERTTKGESPIEIAEKKKFTDIVSLLR